MEAKKIALIRRINDMLPVPEATSLQLVLSLRSRLLAARSARGFNDVDKRELVKQLIADLVFSVAIVRHLAPLFETTSEINAQADAAQSALATFARAYKTRTHPEPAILDELEDFADLFYSIVRQTKLSEYKTVIALAEAELTR